MRIAIIILNSLAFALLSENQKVKTNVSKLNKPLWIVLNEKYFLGLSFLVCLGISFKGTTWFQCRSRKQT